MGRRPWDARAAQASRRRRRTPLAHAPRSGVFASLGPASRSARRSADSPSSRIVGLVCWPQILRQNGTEFYWIDWPPELTLSVMERVGAGAAGMGSTGRGTPPPVSAEAGPTLSICPASPSARRGRRLRVAPPAPWHLSAGPWTPTWGPSVSVPLRARRGPREARIRGSSRSRPCDRSAPGQRGTSGGTSKQLRNPGAAFATPLLQEAEQRRSALLVPHAHQRLFMRFKFRPRRV